MLKTSYWVSVRRTRGGTLHTLSAVRVRSTRYRALLRETSVDFNEEGRRYFVDAVGLETCD